jgi:hypothetical protein
MATARRPGFDTRQGPEIVFSAPERPNLLWHSPPFYPVGTEGSSPGTKKLWREADGSGPASD